MLGVQAAATLARTEQRAAQDKPAAVKALCQVAEPVQTAVLASLGTLPVLVAHGMAASLVGVLCNLLVVWMVQPALQLGILLLVCSAVPFLAAITNLTALVLSLWLKGLLWLVRCCAALPFASICLPQRYTLFVLAVLGALAVCFWRARRLRLYLPAAALLHSAGRGAGCLDAARCCADQSGRRIQQSLRRLRAERAGCGVLPRRGEQLERRAELSGRAQQTGARAGR